MLIICSNVEASFLGMEPKSYSIYYYLVVLEFELRTSHLLGKLYLLLELCSQPFLHLVNFFCPSWPWT
jgi:hypothetical protein